MPIELLLTNVQFILHFYVSVHLSDIGPIKKDKGKTDKPRKGTPENEKLVIHLIKNKLKEQREKKDQKDQKEQKGEKGELGIQRVR